MSAPMRERLEAAFADLRAQRDKIVEFDAAMKTRRTVVTSKNRMVSATVDCRGKLVELSLKGNRYRSMAPAELAALVVETVATAQDKALKEALAAAAELMPRAAKFAGLADGDLDADRMYEAAVQMVGDPVFPEPGADVEAGVTGGV
jgi:hypothetical protein